MIVDLDNYELGQKIVSLALTEDALENLLRENFSVMYLTGNRLRFYPDNVMLELSELAVKKLNSSDNYDVFSISDKGFAYKFYDNEANDVGFMITGHCNSNCVMCPASNGQRKLDSLDIDSLIKIVRQMPKDVKHITITGGEPFLAGERIFELLSEMKAKFPHTRFQILTNGRALSLKKYVDYLEITIPKKTIVCIPLHGYNEETHDSITRSPGGFQQTVKGIGNLLNRDISVEIRMVVSKLNSSNISRIAELIVEKFPTVSRVEIMGLEMLGNAAVNIEQVWIPYREAFQASKNAVDILSENGIEVGLYNFPLCAIDEGYRHIAKKSISDNKVKYADICSQCELKSDCGGIFAGTIRLAGKDVIPQKIL